MLYKYYVQMQVEESDILTTRYSEPIIYDSDFNYQITKYIKEKMLEYFNNNSDEKLIDYIIKIEPLKSLF